MYKIEKRPSGFILTFAGNINVEEIQNWYDDSVIELEKVKAANETYGVIINMKELHPLNKEAQAIIEKGQRLYKESGMQRSAVILPNAIMKLQFTTIAKQSGIYDTERYFNGEETNAIGNAIEWVKNGIDLCQQK